MAKKIRTQIWQWIAIALIPPSVTGVVIGLRLLGWLQPLEWAALDQIFRWRSPQFDDRVVIVGIDEADLQTAKIWPMSDAMLAQLLEKIRSAQPRAIGMDIYRDLPVEPGYASLVKVFRETPNLIGIEKKIGSASSSAVAPAPVLKELDQVGFNDVVLDGDGRVRRGMIFLKGRDGEAMKGLSMRLAERYLQAEGTIATPVKITGKPFAFGQGHLHRFQPNDGSYVNADTGGYQVLLNYRGGPQTFRTVSMTDILNDRIPPETFRQKVVLIGVTAASLNDYFLTPHSGNMMAGVEIQANLVSQLIAIGLDNKSLIQIWADPWEYTWIFGWALLGLIPGWWLQSARRSLLAILGLQGLLAGSSYLFFLQGLWVPVIPAAIALCVTTISAGRAVAAQERKERQVLQQLFDRHVNPEIAQAIWRERDQFLQNGRLVGQKMTATVLFADLKGFTTISEQTDPERLMNWLNEYLDEMSQIVLEHGGIVDKFIGDAVMAVFGVPIPRTTEAAIAQDAQQAVRSALKMARTLETLNQRWQAKGWPTVAMRIGISTGTVVTGSLGGRQRVEYSTVGDSVNVAARLEGYNKSMDQGICRILISETTYHYIQDTYPTQWIDTVQLSGRQQLTPIYAVPMPDSDEPLTPAVAL